MGINGIFFEPLLNANHPTYKVNTVEVGKKLMRGMRLSIASLASKENKLIIDEVMLGDEIDEHTKLLSNFEVFYVAIFAPISVIEDRERNRKDRTIGLARWQYNTVHKNKTYDLQIDTTESSAADAAKLIKSHFNL